MTRLIRDVAVMPACPHCCQFASRFFRSGCAGNEGGGRSKEWSGHGKEKGPLTWSGEGDASGGMESGMGTAVRQRPRKTRLVRIWKVTKQRRQTHLLQCQWQWSDIGWVGHRHMGQRSSERDQLGHRKKMSLHRTLAHSRGQDETGLDTEKKKTWWGVRDWSGQIKK